MKKRQMAITWVITALVLLTLGWYAAIMLLGASASAEAPPVVRFVLIGFILVI